jgi:hypothetical protein
MSGNKDLDAAKETLKYIQDRYGNGYGSIPSGAHQGQAYYYTPSNITNISAGGSGGYNIFGSPGGGGGGGFSINPLTPGPAFTTVDGQIFIGGIRYVPEDMKLNKVKLSDNDVQQLTDICLQKYKEGDTVLIKVGMETDSSAMSMIGNILAANGVKHMFVGLVQPDDITEVEPADLHTLSDDQLTMLSRLAAVWESRPYLTFGSFLSMVFSTEGLASIDDNVLITALEKAYGVDSD